MKFPNFPNPTEGSGDSASLPEVEISNGRLNSSETPVVENQDQLLECLQVHTVDTVMKQYEESGIHVLIL